MALLAFDGFEMYNSKLHLQSRSNSALQWNVSGGANFAPTFPAGRNGNGKCLQDPNASNAQLTGSQARVIGAVLSTRPQTGGVGFATKLDPLVGNGFVFYDTVADAPQIGVSFDAHNYSITVTRGALGGTGTVLYISANNAWEGGTWAYVELWAKVHDGSGWVQVVINGDVVVNLTGVDTKATANAWWDRFDFSKPGSSIGGSAFNLIVDDFYMADDSVGPGSYPGNTPLGDVRVQTLLPTANASVQWTPLSGANYTNVDDGQLDDNGTYNYTSTVGNQDTYIMQTLSGTVSVVLGVQVTTAVRKTDSGTRRYKNVLHSGGSDYLGAEYSVPDVSYAFFTDLWLTDPATAVSWTALGVNSLTAGYKLTT